LAVTTRFNAAEVELGWTKRVNSPFAIEKLFQLITARSVCWFTISVAASGRLKLAAPPTTCSPIGLAQTCAGTVLITTTATPPNNLIPAPTQLPTRRPTLRTQFPPRYENDRLTGIKTRETFEIIRT
jgi:hypothetical protein